MIVRALDEAQLRKVDPDWDPRISASPSGAKLPYSVVRRIVADGFDVPEADFLVRRAFKRLAWPRFGLIFWVRAFCKEPGVTRTGRAAPMSYPAIATRLDAMDHTTIIHGEKRARELWGSDAAFAAQMDRCWLKFQEMIDAA